MMHKFPNNDKVSIIIPVFNRELIIKETLNSVIKQEYTYWECIIIDDGSIDNTLDVLSKYSEKDSRIKFWQRDRLPKGANTCRNIGIEHATGNYVMFLDSDDLLISNCLSSRLEQFSKHSSYDFLVFPTLVTKDDIPYKVFNVEYKDYLEAFISHEVPWTIMGAIYKTNVIKQIGGFDENLPRLQDVDLNVRILLKNYSFLFFNKMEADNIYRSSNTEIGQSQVNKILESAVILINKLVSNKEINIQKSVIKRALTKLYINFLRRYALYYPKTTVISHFVNYNIKLDIDFRSKSILYIQRFLFNKELLKIYPIKIMSYFLWRFFKTIK